MSFFLPRLDQTSFWIGFIAATIIWMLLSYARPQINQLILKYKDRRILIKTRTISLVEEHYRSAVRIQAQRSHLASSLFPLDEICIEPKLLAPPPRINPDESTFHKNLVSEIVPYLPSWPELGSVFNAPTLTIKQALSGKSDVVLIGQPGSGKSFALAYIASNLLSQGSEDISEIASYENSLPFLIHIADLDLEAIDEKEPLNLIIDYLKSFTKTSDITRIPTFVKKAFKTGQAILLLDGTDELTPDNISSLIKFIRLIKQNYPSTQIVTTGIPENLNGLVTLNFVPFTLANWDSNNYDSFLSKWGQLWTKFVETEAWSQTTHIDPFLLKVWLNSINSTLSPFEITLLAWGCFAGDITSGNILDAVKAHINRLKPQDTPLEALEMLALQVFTSTNLVFEPRKAREWIRSFEPDEGELTDGKQGNSKIIEIRKIKLKKGNAPTTPSLGLISKFAETGILISNINNSMRFAHPILGGYLAGKILGSVQPEKVLNLPNWSGKYLAMNFYAAFEDAEILATKLLELPDRPLERNTLLVARWLRYSKPGANWWNRTMESLAAMLRIPNQPLGFRGQVLSAIIQSGEPGVPLLLRQMLSSDDPELLQLCILGCALLKDTKSIESIAKLLNHHSPNVYKAACLALVKIGTRNSLDLVASVLLHGDENSRATAAMALAFNAEEGHSMLREGSLMDDIMVRRAVTYGLGLIDEFWATEILTKLQLEDNQWIVRNAATEVLDNKLVINRYVPNRLPPPSECPWLIAFAGKKGVGISPNSPATDILLMALTEGDETEQLASLDYLKTFASSNVFAVFYKFLYGNNIVLREAIFRAIWEMGSRGVKIPDPSQFGVN